MLINRQNGAELLFFFGLTTAADNIHMKIIKGYTQDENTHKGISDAVASGRQIVVWK